MSPQAPLRVAVVGTGLAGLSTAYLLQNDEQQRYAVTLFEQAESLSFDSASVAVREDRSGSIERIDLPMRALAGGYYPNVMRMYDHLGIPYHPIRFLFSFAKSLPERRPDTIASGKNQATLEGAGGVPGEYFVHASNLHQAPPWPGSRGIMAHLVEILYLIICQFWFTVACFMVHPMTEGSDGGETFGEYLERIWLPRRYATHYLLPLISSVATCTHAELLAFPASDVVEYKKRSHGQQHYTVCGGVHQVEGRLAKEMKEVRLGACVAEVASTADGRVRIRWQSTRNAAGQIMDDVFDRVILAVSPDVAGKIFQPLRKILEPVPTIRVESSVLRPLDAEPSQSFTLMEDEGRHPKACSHHRGNAMPPQVICLRTDFSAKEAARTEALHTMPRGTVVSTCPLDVQADAKRVLRTARFTRTLRTRQSRAVVRKIMGEDRNLDKKNDQTAGMGDWTNGQDNVWLTGAWCWDGMVLLEGCVISAMRIADDFAFTITFLRRKDVYDNDHWKLNLKVPFTTMWMNMGYWTNANNLRITDFETACRNLLIEVLKEAQIWKDVIQSAAISLLDLGVGCGDQSLELARLIDERGVTSYRYVGLTINESQYRLASTRVRLQAQKLKLEDGSVEIFCTDAANPETWGAHVKSAIRSLKEDSTDRQRWVLALDSLYHFYPSRKPIFTYAAQTLDASFMAFDLILSDGASLRQRFLVKLIGLAMGCPTTAFVTMADYKKQLVDAGYDEDHIHFKDITEHVFSGLVSYIKSQSEALQPFGISAGKFKVAAIVFDWFAKSNAMRGTIVIARKRSKAQGEASHMKGGAK
ncbi:hypothetical protein HER10_EVM0004247 [Colletotrichum scovillei]|uniref:uncharacterized protein n=1 Tax=Colletotrichum scovillei TaxID=1209932 RepID=UPI0015C30FCB|nr:uncharacterized protein HER10_EVM0004247 [Colletotrichum scovillei]KAF4776195.1 hypothetical protein HER10_EVM0004247 [Colletotrichum scovillei]